MNDPTDDSKSTPLGPIAPFFIVEDVPRAVRFYGERLGFEARVTMPAEEPFFAIVGRGPVQILLKEVSDDTNAVPPLPNRVRHEWAPWDAFVSVADPDALAHEFSSRGVEFHRPLEDRSDGLRGFEVCDADGYALFFGRPA